MREEEEVFFLSGSQHRVPGIETPVALPFGDTSLPENLIPHLLSYSQGFPADPSMLSTEFNVLILVLSVPIAGPTKYPEQRDKGQMWLLPKCPSV